MGVTANAEDPAAIDGGLWSQLSHDFRQPLQSLLLLSHLVAEMSDPADRRKAARSMEETLLAVQGMIETVALISRFDAGAVAPAPGLCNLSEVIGRIAHEVEAEVPGLSVSVSSAAPAAMATVDLRLLDLAVRGLLLNAARLESQGRVEVVVSGGDGAPSIDVACSARPQAAQSDRALFVEFVRTRDGVTSGLPIAAPALIECLVGHLGGRLEIGAEPGDRQHYRILLA